MDPQELMRRLCRRHGVIPARGERLLPLVRWALESPREIRERILKIVEDTLAWHARTEEAPGEASGSAASPTVLVAVAKVLHGWSPSDRILGPDEGRSGSEPAG